MGRHTRHRVRNVGILRQDAENQIERLIALLDLLDGDPDLEPSLSGYSEGMDDREGDDAYGAQEDSAENGIGDLEGYMEQCPSYFQHRDQRVE